MSNALALATVSEALRLLIAENLGPEIDMAVNVETKRPPTEPPAEPTITVFLYQVTPNAALRNQDAPTRAADGTLLRRPTAAVDLHYLITGYGEETELTGQRLIGAVVRTLHEIPVLSRELIERAAQSSHLTGSDLATSPQRVRFTPTQMDVDETSKLWGMLHHTPYALSVVYQATLVLLEGREDPAAGKPVLRRSVTAVPGLRPRLDRVGSRPAGADYPTPEVEGPVPLGHELVLTGSGLAAGPVTAHLGRHQVPVAADDVKDGQVVVVPPEDLEPGPHRLRLVYAGAARGLDSNAVTFARQAGLAEPARFTDTAGGDLRTGTVALRLDMPIGDEQRVELLLDELRPPENRRAFSYRFHAPFPAADREDPATLRVPVKDVQPAGYLVRVRVDGVPSAIEQTPDGTFAGPALDLTAPPREQD
ncbi:DUF4255 domain-containing protein [Streptomyces hainanensis]|uniref:DUF4255 domain-containing protein n=1 Tax=Streptomyces hainanensis TaxID=402648 RepID=A0A4R4SH50_9ACTN|nr:DUF4255 domain-containing protein [Streptomyces hainanensis]TDC60733.1 DUF4255 domain-containing protein [Streptomyces hainanensis]